MIPAVDEGILRTAAAVMAVHADLALDLADAVNVTLAQEYRTDCLLTVDERDFRAVRPLTAHKAFRLLPHDRRRSTDRSVVRPRGRDAGSFTAPSVSRVPVSAEAGASVGACRGAGSR
ncbi:hypothetical protein [Streptomyces purpureus]|uniref:PIN domain-containing protein n=1 Tax=Streptomyces purpureus TaxID=1951 RepID=A0A918H497_9ACTN|nr:hypothetical protein GCM10014713_29650 [Streptomyces purpureus]